MSKQGRAITLEARHSGESRIAGSSTPFSDLVEPVNEMCHPTTAGTQVYVGLEHIESGAFQLRRFGHPDEVTSAKSRFRRGDILYGKLRPYLDKAVFADRDGICSTDVLVFRPSARTIAGYVLAQIHSQAFRDHAVATTKGVNHPRTSWSGLADFECFLPPKPEQEKIASVLSKLQRAIATQDRLIAATRDLKQSAMQRLFTHGLHAETTRETPYGHVPEVWREQPLGACCHVQTGVTKGRTIAAEEAVDVPYLRVANVQDGHLDLREIKTITIRKSELPGYMLQEGDVVLTEGGDFDKLGRGFIWHGQLATCVHQNHVFAVRANRSLLTPEFLAYLVQSPYGKAYFLTVAHKTTNLASINSTKLKALPVLLPSLDEQREIATALATIDRKLSHHQRKRAALNDLFQTLLHQLMTAQIRVADLDIDTSDVTSQFANGALA